MLFLGFEFRIGGVLLLFVACVVCMLVVWCGLRYLAWLLRVLMLW